MLVYIYSMIIRAWCFLLLSTQTWDEHQRRVAGFFSSSNLKLVWLRLGSHRRQYYTSTIQALSKYAIIWETWANWFAGRHWWLFYLLLPFSSVSALEFTDYMAEAGMFIWESVTHIAGSWISFHIFVSKHTLEARLNTFPSSNGS